MAVKNIKTLLRKLDALEKGYSKGLERGLLKAGLKLQREAQKLVPIDTGALKASARTELDKTSAKMNVTVMFTQYYAIWVHEDLTSYHPVGQAKYLETPYRRLKKELIQLVIDEAKKGRRRK